MIARKLTAVIMATMCWVALLINAPANAVNLPVVKATRKVAPEITSLLLEDIFLGDRLGARQTDNSLVARLKNTLRSPKHAIYSDQIAKFNREQPRSSEHYHGKIVLFKLRNGSWSIGIAAPILPADVGATIEDEVLINSYRVRVEDIQGVLVWNSSLYGTLKYYFAKLSADNLMYVIDKSTLDFMDGSEDFHELFHYRLNDSNAASLVDGLDIAGMPIATFSDGSTLVVGEAYRDLGEGWTSWQNTEADRPLQVYLIK